MSRGTSMITLSTLCNFCVIAVACLSYLFGPLSALAQLRPDPVTGFTHIASEALADGERYGVVLSGNDVGYASPVIAEIDSVSDNGKEIAIAGADGVVYVYHSDGTLLWSGTTPNATCPDQSSGNRVLSSPAVGALFGDGIPYVVIGYGGVGGGSCDGGVIAFDGRDGTIRWTFSLKKFSKKERFWTNSHSVFSTPALADTDGNGTLEIGFASFDRNVYLLNANGKPRWYYNAADTSWSSAAFANIDDDPRLEMIIGTDISSNKVIQPPTSDGGYVYAFKTKGRRGKRILFRDPSSFVWKVDFDQTMMSAPVVADVLPSNPGNEIIIGSGCYFPSGSNEKRGRWFKVLSAKTGGTLATLDVEACSPSSPAVGDLNGDGVLEIVVTASGDSSLGGDGSSRVIAFDVTSGEALWETIPRFKGQNDSWGGNFTSPTIADVDGNGSLEVVVANSTGISVLDGITGSSLTCTTRVCDTLPMIDAYGLLRGTPAMGDLNNDGVLDLVIAGESRYSGHGGLYAWTNFSSVITSSEGPHPAYATPWPMYRGNAQRTGK